MEALTETLKASAFEDSTQHGRLLALKDSLQDLTAEKQLNKEQLAHFYVKDVLEKCGGFEEEADHEECLASYLHYEFDEKMLESIIATR